ncbi:hypothetical protein L3Q72_07660 [Vibrio sp. JC009]|uniref:hypothetical protein n=1 Tax=Vibrio sp. JC009 TaxID=2912314 RepID=UPI0023B02C22|nr:hypothetical protein [Vibrio sp. JC009]WED20532.1 hypothetical protein L3Q72_07660 [Vibrio sp. JC009]
MKKALLALAATAVFSGSALSAEYTLTVPHVANLDNYNHQSLLVFKNLVENRSNGRVEVKIYPSAQLCSTTKECMAGVQAGMFDYFQSTSYLRKSPGLSSIRLCQKRRQLNCKPGTPK